MNVSTVMNVMYEKKIDKDKKKKYREQKKTRIYICFIRLKSP